jgi:hypothetical protein
VGPPIVGCPLPLNIFADTLHISHVACIKREDAGGRIVLKWTLEKWDGWYELDESGSG